MFTPRNPIANPPQIYPASASLVPTDLVPMANQSSLTFLLGVYLDQRGCGVTSALPSVCRAGVPELHRGSDPV